MGSKTRKPELAIIAGCLEGLNCSLVNFTESVDEGCTDYNVDPATDYCVKLIWL